MLRCQDCELYSELPDGSAELLCDPYSTIKEPECLIKHQLAQLKVIAESHKSTLELYQRFAPLQERMFRHIEREIDEAEEADSWKLVEDEDEDEDDSLRL